MDIGAEIVIPLKRNYTPKRTSQNQKNLFTVLDQGLNISLLCNRINPTLCWLKSEMWVETEIGQKFNIF